MIALNISRIICEFHAKSFAIRDLAVLLLKMTKSEWGVPQGSCLLLEEFATNRFSVNLDSGYLLLM